MSVTSNPVDTHGDRYGNAFLLGDAPSLSSSGVYNHFGAVSSGADVVGAIQVGDTIRTIDVAAQ